MFAHSKFSYYLKLILALLLWAGLYHIAKPATIAADPFLVGFLRYTIAAVIFLCILKIRSKSFNPNFNLTQWFLVAAVGSVGVFAYNVFFLNAEALISGNIVAILYAFAPCLTTLISSIVFKTRLNLLSKIGIVIALLGSLGVINYATPSCGQYFCTSIFTSIGRGEIFGVLATISFACYSVLSKYTSSKNVSSLPMNTYAAVFGSILLGITASFKSDFSVLSHVGLSFWAAIFYIAVLATIIAYLWYIDAIIHLGVFKTVVFQNTIPLQTVLIGYLFFHSQIGLGELVCGGVILLGVYITNYALTKAYCN